jgi:hypothetical protein
MTIRDGTLRVLVALTVAVPPVITPRQLSAQVAAPEIVLSASGGYTFQRAMWSLRQPVVVPEPGPLLIDTFLLARRLAPGASAWVGLTWYPRPTAGFGAEAGWVAAQVGTGCAILGTPQPDPFEQNTVACARLGHDRFPTSAIAALATVTVRATPGQDYSPFVKAGVGFALLGHPFDAVTSHSTGSTCTDCTRVILEGGERLVTWAATVAAGVAIGGVSSHRLRVEVRDIVLGLPVVTGPANPLAEHPVPPTSTRAVHRFILAFGLDAVLNGKHRRRY